MRPRVLALPLAPSRAGASRGRGRGPRKPLIVSRRLTDEGDEMLAYERRSRWIRRMQDRAARRREREWARQADLDGDLLVDGAGARRRLRPAPPDRCSPPGIACAADALLRHRRHRLHRQLPELPPAGGRAPGHRPGAHAGAGPGAGPLRCPPLHRRRARQGVGAPGDAPCRGGLPPGRLRSGGPPRPAASRGGERHRHPPCARGDARPAHPQGRAHQQPGGERRHEGPGGGRVVPRPTGACPRPTSAPSGRRTTRWPCP